MKKAVDETILNAFQSKCENLLYFFKAGSYFVNLSLIHVSLEEDKMFYVVNITERIKFK